MPLLVPLLPSLLPLLLLPAAAAGCWLFPLLPPFLLPLLLPWLLPRLQAGVSAVTTGTAAAGCAQSCDKTQWEALPGQHRSQCTPAALQVRQLLGQLRPSTTRPATGIGWPKDTVVMMPCDDRDACCPEGGARLHPNKAKTPACQQRDRRGSMAQVYCTG
jgi:hypothetical protein